MGRCASFEAAFVNLHLRIVRFRARESHAGSALLLGAGNLHQPAPSGHLCGANAGMAGCVVGSWGVRMRLEGAALPYMDGVDAFVRFEYFVARHCLQAV